MKKKIYILIIIISMLFLSSCGLVSNSQKTQNVTNEVTNKITNEVVNYENLTIDDLENCITHTAEMLENSVVGVTLMAEHTVYVNGKTVVSEDKEAIGSGVIYKRIENKNASGQLVDYTYYVVTNRHVITGSSSANSYKIYVYLGYEYQEIECQIVGQDEKVDIAVIKFNHTTLIQPVEFANSDEIKKGQFAIAIGNPDGYDYYGSVTFGVISGELRYLNDDTDNDGVNDFCSTFIQHDVAINPGNSGGGLFTIDGKLIGINTLKIVDDTIDNMGFAIPINEVKNLIENYIEPGIKIERPRLGITGMEVSNMSNAIIAQNGLKELPDIYNGVRKYGVYVVSVTSNSTISQTGILADDIILEFDGEKITNMSELTAKLNSATKYKVGTKVSITYYSRKLNKIVTEDVVLKSETR
jgi:serine protease DO